MRRIPAAAFRRMPWRNGGGETAEIVAFPPEANLAGFDWRVSLATVAAAGPFSTFPEVDRTLAVVSGTLDLRFEGREAVTLDPATPPLAFPADVAVWGEPRGGPVTDLNVMTRRGRFRHRLSRLDAREPQSLRPQGEVMLVLCRDGDAILVERGEAVEAMPLLVADLWRVPG